MKFFSFLIGLFLALLVISRLGLKPHVVAQNLQNPSEQASSNMEPHVNQNNIQQQSETDVHTASVKEAHIGAGKIPDDVDEELLLGERNPYLPPKYILDLEYVKPEETVYIDDKMEAIRRWALSEYLLIGILWDVHQPKVMIRDKNKTLHILKKNQRIGNKDGIISQINEGEMIVLEQGVPRVIKIASTLPDKINLAEPSQQPALSPRNNMLMQSQIQQQLQQLKQQIDPGVSFGQGNTQNQNNNQNNFQNPNTSRPTTIEKK